MCLVPHAHITHVLDMTVSTKRTTLLKNLTWNWLSDLIPTDKNTPRPYLQNSKTPFGCHRAGINSGPAVSTIFFPRIGAHLETNHWQLNQQWSHVIQRERQFPHVITSFKLTLLSSFMTSTNKFRVNSSRSSSRFLKVPNP